MRQFILSNRYLLLACMTVVIVLEPLFLHHCVSPSDGPNASPGASASSVKVQWPEAPGPTPKPIEKHFVAPGSLEEKYQRIQLGMSHQDVSDILGPPDKIEYVFFDLDIWSWRKSGDSICLGMCGGVVFRQFNSKETPEPQ
jgi:hypothetical protein